MTTQPQIGELKLQNTPESNSQQDKFAELCNLILIHPKDQGCNQDLTKAKELFEQYVALGNPYSMTNLGFLYQTGQGVLQNSTKAKNFQISP